MPVSAAGSWEPLAVVWNARELLAVPGSPRDPAREPWRATAWLQVPEMEVLPLAAELRLKLATPDPGEDGEPAAELLNTTEDAPADELA